MLFVEMDQLDYFCQLDQLKKLHFKVDIDIVNLPSQQFLHKKVQYFEIF